MPSPAESLLRPLTQLVSGASKATVEDEVLRILHERKVPTRIDHHDLLATVAQLSDTVRTQQETIAALTARLEALEQAQPQRRALKKKRS